MRGTHTPLSDSEIAELRAMFLVGSDVGLVTAEGRARLHGYVSRLIVDLLAVRVELRQERRRALTEIERLRDVLTRARPHLSRRVADEDLAALLAEIEDVLARRPR